MPGACGAVSRQQSGPSPAATTSDAGPWGVAFIVSVVFTLPSIATGPSRGQPIRSDRATELMHLDLR